jgi:hypothetical protein
VYFLNTRIPAVETHHPVLKAPFLIPGRGCSAGRRSGGGHGPS